jgi:hypothetical protein
MPSWIPATGSTWNCVSSESRQSRSQVSYFNRDDDEPGLVAQIQQTQDKEKSQSCLKHICRRLVHILIYLSCPSCLSPDNVTVKYYSKKHICINCRKFLRDSHGNLIKLFVNKEGDIICLGIYKMTDEHLKLQ